MDITTTNSCCSVKDSPAPSRPISWRVGLCVAVLLVAGWWTIYVRLAGLATYLTYSVLRLPHNHLGASIEFFLFEVPKVLMLLVSIVFAVGILRTFFTPQATRRMLVGKRESVGNVLAALLGVVTPFCSCSAVPLFIGFVTAGVPLGVTFSFLIAAPMINEVALVLLLGMFGWKVALIYLGTGLLIAILAGWIIGRLGMERHIEGWVFEVHVGDEVESSMSWPGRMHAGLDAIGEIVGKVWPYVVAGIAVGAGIHGYVPTNALASLMGKEAWWSVPVSVLIGVPMYSNAAGIIPIVHALLEKGAALGTVLAFMMAVIGLSLPEIIILRNVLKPRLIATFVGVVAFGILVVGHLFNLLGLA